MVVHVIGKQHLQGTSRKTGKPFNNTILHVLHPAKEVEGYQVDMIWLSAIDYPVSSFSIDSDYDIVYDGRGWVTDVKRVK